MKDNTPTLTPIETVGGVFVKRDDLYCIAGIRGGKVRACWELATGGPKPCHGLITASARRSPQAQIVARLAGRLGVPARCHMPTGEHTEEMRDMLAHGAELVQHRAGYNNVIIARAKADHAARPGWRYIPFGMEHPAAVACTEGQVESIPLEMAFGNIELPRRVVVCVGSGMSAAGILHGLRSIGGAVGRIPVVGIRIGADPTRRLNTFGPFGWYEQLTLIDVTEEVPYHKPVEARLGRILLDPYYEAKCLEYVRPGDLFWVVGVRTTHATTTTKGRP